MPEKNIHSMDNTTGFTSDSIFFPLGHTVISKNKNPLRLLHNFSIKVVTPGVNKLEGIKVKVPHERQLEYDIKIPTNSLIDLDMYIIDVKGNNNYKVFKKFIHPMDLDKELFWKKLWIRSEIPIEWFVVTFRKPRALTFYLEG